MMKDDKSEVGKSAFRKNWPTLLHVWFNIFAFAPLYTSRSTMNYSAVTIHYVST
jgi:hypothetical protein